MGCMGIGKVRNKLTSLALMCIVLVVALSPLNSILLKTLAQSTKLLLLAAYSS
jgi:hypothetical protein